MNHKYGAIKTTVDGFVFPSTLEADTYRALRDIHDCGGMVNLKLQVPYSLHGANNQPVCCYQLDFLAELPTGAKVGFESKGVMTQVASLKLKLFRAQYPDIPLIVVTSANLATLQSVASIVRTSVKSYRSIAFLTELEEHFLPKKKLSTQRKSRANSKSQAR